jgi:hypothetical protein
VGAAALAAAAVGSGVEILSRAGGGSGATRLAAGGFGLRRSDYTPHVGRRFKLVPENGPPVPARLVAVENFPGSWALPLAGSEDAFILLFHAPAGAPRPAQATMTITGPGGSFGHLLLSPAGPGRAGLDYAAVVNRVIPYRRREHG